MSFVQIVSAFRLYRADVLVLALGVTLLVSLLKKTLLKNANKKIFVFLPFAVGIVLFAGYRMAVTVSFAPLSAEFPQTLEGGFGCGCAATLYYIVYSKFLRGKTACPLYPLLEFIPEKEREQAAEKMYAETQALSEEEMKIYFSEHLNTYSDPPMSEEELAAAAEVLTEFLMSLRK